ncbi:MAG TPA: hypothetical protein VEX41_01965, partial [Candidatus Eisenbacteria bacterium]|nr:hypothetical protein [Candidatus Eisenbacteria bacterium]
VRPESPRRPPLTRRVGLLGTTGDAGRASIFRGRRAVMPAAHRFFADDTDATLRRRWRAARTRASRLCRAERRHQTEIR